MTEPERFLVTGANGPVGAWVVKLLLAEGVTVSAFGDSEDDHRLRLIATSEELMALRHAPGSVTDLESLRVGMAGASHVIHLDTVSPEACEDNPGRAANEAVIGTANVFATAEAVGIVGLAFGSSMSVYSPRSLPVEAEAPVEPSSLRGVFHRANELIAERYRADHSVSSIGLRLGLVYGPGHDRGDLAMTTVAIAAAVDKRPFHVSHGGMADFQFVRDVATAFIGAARAASRQASVVNLRGEPHAIADFLRAVATLTGADGLTAAGSLFPLPLAGADPAEAEFLGSRPTTSIVEGIRETLETFRWSPRDLYRSA